MTELMQTRLESLPDSLSERSRLVREARQPLAGEFVLYWMRSAIRVDENPALDVSMHLANQLELPVLVYQTLGDDEPYASDRHHTFVLQGARDVQASIGNCGVEYAFQLKRATEGDAGLKALAERSAAVIIEQMPTVWHRHGTALLAAQVTASIIAVDTACVVPMQLVGSGYDRAYAFRRATKELYDQRVTRREPPLISKIVASVPTVLPFDPVDLQSSDLGALVGQCDIDHSIGPVPHTVGGSLAGYQRWDVFKAHGLSKYHRRRNDALQDGVSRMSPYLHHGMVSPMRLAREAFAVGGEGPGKFLDELLIWRELAYAFCFYRENHDDISAIPDWAVTTLHEHECDPRPSLLSWETLARGRSGDPLWDAAQRSLLIHGELHNNVRMTWGKAILNWTAEADYCAGDNRRFEPSVCLRWPRSGILRWHLVVPRAVRSPF